jgi:hypothetical protein
LNVGRSAPGCLLANAFGVGCSMFGSVSLFVCKKKR